MTKRNRASQTPRSLRLRLANAGALFGSPTAPGLLLIACTALALTAANSGLAAGYASFFHQEISIGAGRFLLAMPLHTWINDGLMAIFFFAIGLEIKRELLVGHLSSFKRSALPIVAALGGMVVPGLIYAAFNVGGPGLHGWAIPTATDIAFAVGVLALLGDRVPPPLKVFLLALAIVDDLGAVAVIATFYTESIAPGALAIAGVGLLVAVGMNTARVRTPAAYAVIGAVVWLAMLKSGVHATIAGVLMGFTIPVRTAYDGRGWLRSLEAAVDRYRTVLGMHTPDSREELGARQTIIHEIERSTEKAQSPLIRLEHTLGPWVTFLIMPIFAFTNAGVAISGGSISSAAGDPVAWGVLLGLFLGKQVGVFLFGWTAVRLRLAMLPAGTRWSQYYGVAIIAGIGFTMSLFVTELSFDGRHELAETAKLAILVASGLSGIAGYVWLRIASRRSPG